MAQEYNRHGYNGEAVNAAIAASRKPIGKREARMIHALLKGRQPAAVSK